MTCKGPFHSAGAPAVQDKDEVPSSKHAVSNVYRQDMATIAVSKQLQALNELGLYLRGSAELSTESIIACKRLLEVALLELLELPVMIGAPPPRGIVTLLPSGSSSVIAVVFTAQQQC